MKRLAVVFVLCLAPVAAALGRNDSMLDLAQQSDLVFTGTVIQVGTKTATIQIDKFLMGEIDAPTIVVTPVTASTDVGPYINIKAGESVLLFTKQNAAGEPATIVGDGAGKLSLTPETAAASTAAAARLIQIGALKDDDARNLAMIAEAESKNAVLRQVAYNHLSLTIAYAKNHDNYKMQLIALLNSPEPLAQRGALNALRFVDAPETIPRMIELTSSTDEGVVDSASLCLGKYVTTDVTAALIALTQSPNPRIRERATLDLGNNHHDLAKAALAARLNDKDPAARAIAPTGLIELLRAGKADDLIPKIAALLNDPVEDVAASAARALGETRNPAAIAPLIDVLQRKDLGHNLQYFTLQALYSHYTYDTPEAKSQMDKHIDIFIAILKSDRQLGSATPAFQAVGILSACKLPEAKAALQWAADSHPNPEIRDYAKSSLK